MTPGPMKAFFERLRARRGAQVAAVATARKLAVLFWHLLTREEDYAFARQSMTRQKLRALELATGAKPQRGRQHAEGPLRNPKIRAAERKVSEQAEVAYRRMVADWRRQPTGKKGRSLVAAAKLGDRRMVADVVCADQPVATSSWHSRSIPREERFPFAWAWSRRATIIFGS